MFSCQFSLLLPQFPSSLVSLFFFLLNSLSFHQLNKLESIQGLPRKREENRMYIQDFRIMWQHSNQLGLKHRDKRIYGKLIILLFNNSKYHDRWRKCLIGDSHKSPFSCIIGGPLFKQPQTVCRLKHLTFFEFQKIL